MRARARRHCLFAGGSGLNFLPEQEKQKKGINAVATTRDETSGKGHWGEEALTPVLRPLTAARYARLRQRAQHSIQFQGQSNLNARMANRKHIQHIRLV